MWRFLCFRGTDWGWIRQIWAIFRVALSLVGVRVRLKLLYRILGVKLKVIFKMKLTISNYLWPIRL